MAKKSLFWTITLLLVMILTYVFTISVIVPVFTKNPLPEAYVPKVESKAENNTRKQEKAENGGKKNDKSDKNNKKTEKKVLSTPVTDSAISNSKEELNAYFEVKKQEILLRNLYNLASEDSSYLLLDLVKKVATLHMKGIPLHDSQLENVWISNSIKMFHSEALLRWLSQPFVVKNVVGTIERVQFLVKNAPKDTIEANKAEAIPAPRRTEDVFLVMNFERNLQLIIQQSELSEGDDKARIDSLKSVLVRSETEKSIKALTNLKRDAMVPKIIVTMTKMDAITLYRALPQKLKMVIRM